MKWHRYPDEIAPLCQDLLLYLEEYVPPGIIPCGPFNPNVVLGWFNAEEVVSIKKENDEIVYTKSNPLRAYRWADFNKKIEIDLDEIKYWALLEKPKGE